MERLLRYRVLVSGILSPIMAILLSALVNGVLMRWSADPRKDWLFRRSLMSAKVGSQEHRAMQRVLNMISQ